MSRTMVLKHLLLLFAGLALPAQAPVPSLLPPARNFLPSKGTINVLVVPIEFPGSPHDESKMSVDIINKVFFGDGYVSPGSVASAQPVSVRNWYRTASYGQLEIKGEVFPWELVDDSPNTEIGKLLIQAQDGVITPGTAHARIIEEVLTKHAEFGLIDITKGVGSLDLTKFDNNKNGKIDQVIVLFSHPDDGSRVWYPGQKGDFPDAGFKIHTQRSMHTTDINEDLGVDGYIWERGSETNYSLWVHELGHAFGLPDLYQKDRDYGGSGCLDMMDDAGGDLNCFFKYLLGWITPKLVNKTTQGISLGREKDPNIPNDAKAVIISPTMKTLDPFGEYFMVEHRSGLEVFGQDGLLIWHVNAALNDAKLDFLHSNNVQDSYTPSHKLLRLMEADGLEEIDNPEHGRFNLGDYYLPGNIFGVETRPGSNLYDGSSIWMGVSNIRYPTGTPADSIAFDVYLDDSAPEGVPPQPTGKPDATLGTCTFTFLPGEVKDLESGIGGYQYQLSLLGPGKQVYREGFTTNSNLVVEVLPTDISESYRSLYPDQIPLFARTRVLNGAGLGTMDWSDWSAAVTAPVAKPTINSFSPAAGAPGTNVTIRGLLLEKASGVVFGGGVQTSGFTVYPGDKAISASVPKGAKTGPIKVISNGYPDAVSLASFQVLSPEEILAFNSIAGWSMSTGQAVLSTDGSSGVMTVSLVNATDFAKITSQKLSSFPRPNPKQLSIAFRSLYFDVAWGGITVFFNSQSSNPKLNNVPTNYVEVRGFKAEEWHNLTWDIPDNVLQALQGKFNDLQITFQISLPKGSIFQLDGPR